MARPKVIDPDEWGQVLGLLVHDLRNPAATITANVDFLQEVGLVDTDSVEALQDVKLAVGELRRGLDMLAWVSRWLSGQVPLEAANGDVGMFLERLRRVDTPTPVSVEIAEGQQLYAQGAQVAVEVVELLLHNTRANVADPRATVRVFQARWPCRDRGRGRWGGDRAGAPRGRILARRSEGLEGSPRRALQPFRRVCSPRRSSSTEWVAPSRRTARKARRSSGFSFGGLVRLVRRLGRALTELA